MVTLVPKSPRVQQKPANLLPRMQSRTNVDVARTLFSNSLILDGPELQDWQIVLQILRLELASEPPQFSPDDGGRGGRDRAPLLLEPDENPVGGGSHRPIWPEDPAGGGERWPSFPPDSGGSTTGGDAPLLAEPHEPPVRGGSHHPQFPTEKSGSGEADEDERAPRFQPEEPGGKGARRYAFPVERPGTEGDEDEDGVTFPQEPLEDEVFPSFFNPGQVLIQRLVAVPQFPEERDGKGGKCFTCFNPQQVLGIVATTGPHQWKFITDERTQQGLVFPYNVRGLCTSGVQRLAAVPQFPDDDTQPVGNRYPQFPPEDLAGGTEGPIYCFSYGPPPENPGGAGGD